MTSPATSSFQAARSQIRSLSNDSLLSCVEALVAKERRLEIHVLLHLSEVERRKLHLDLGFRSMFAYCIGALGYSRSGAGRRLQATRCLIRYPRVARLVETSKLTITTVCLIAPVLNRKNEHELLDQVRGRTQEQVERILVSFGRQVVVKERVTRVRSNDDQSSNGRGRPGQLRVLSGTDVGTLPSQPSLLAPSSSSPEFPSPPPSPSPPVPPSEESKAAPPSIDDDSNTCVSTDAAAKGTSAAGETAPASSEPQSQSAESPVPTEKFRLCIGVDAGFMAKLERAQSLCSGGASGKVKIVVALEAGLDRYLEQNCPIERHKRRQERRVRRERQRCEQGVEQVEARTSDAAGTPSPVDPTQPQPPSRSTQPPEPAQSTQPTQPIQPVGPKRRPISVATRDAVLARDEGRCTYLGDNGRRCDSTLHLEIDHRVPRALGGSDAMDNLRTLCRAHNQREADRILGEAFMDRRRGHRVPDWDVCQEAWERGNDESLNGTIRNLS